MYAKCNSESRIDNDIKRNISNFQSQAIKKTAYHIAALVAKLEKLFLDAYMYFDPNIAILQKWEKQAPAINFIAIQLFINLRVQT